MGQANRTYYNPITNEIIRSSFNHRQGFESCGHTKFAEAMTYVDDDLRFELWTKTKNSEYRGIPLEDCSTRLRNQLQKIGVKAFPKNLYYKKSINKGLDLLRRIVKNGKS